MTRVTNTSGGDILVFLDTQIDGTIEDGTDAGSRIDDITPEVAAVPAKGIWEFRFSPTGSPEKKNY